MCCFKEKNAEDVTDAFEQILTYSKQKPLLLHTDMGKKFVNWKFEKLLSHNNIIGYNMQGLSE